MKRVPGLAALCVWAVAVLVVQSSGSPAVAHAPLTPNEVVHAVSAALRVVGPDGSVAKRSESERRMGATVSQQRATLSVSIPPSVSSAVRINGPMGAVGIRFPEERRVHDLQLVGESAVYLASSSGVSHVVQEVSGGVRIMSVIPSARAAHSLAYALDLPVGARLVGRADGSIEVSYTSDGFDVVIGTVGVPWAVDSDGQPLKTHYRIQGSSIIQEIIGAPSTAYPVVADPSFYACFPGLVSVALCIKMSRTETVSSWNAVAQLSTVAAAAYIAEQSCGKLPSRVRVPRLGTVNAKALCKTIVAVYAANMLNDLRKAAGASGKCLVGRAHVAGLPVSYFDPFVVDDC